MLKLTVKPGESVKIGEDIKIVLTTSTYSRAQIEIDAPEDIKICRQKVKTPNSRIIIVREEG